MILSNYGIELIRLEPHWLEILRQWRNDPHISQFMEFREYISPQMQLDWFSRIDTLHNYYFIIAHKEQSIGLIHLSSIDFEKRNAEVGLFISNASFIGTPVPVFASLALLDFAFLRLNLKKVMAKVKEDNQNALKYNFGLGFQLLEKTSRSDFMRIVLNKDVYLQKCINIKKAIRHIHPDPEKIRFNDSQRDAQIKQWLVTRSKKKILEFFHDPPDDTL